LPTLELLRLALYQFRGFAHTTWSHKFKWAKNEQGTERWRLALLTSRLVTTAEEYELCWEWVVSFLPFCVGKDSHDCSRLWYLPCRDVHGEFHFTEFNGETIDVDMAVELSRRERAKAKAASNSEASERMCGVTLSPEEEEIVVDVAVKT